MKTVYHNGRIYIGEGAFCEAFSVENGKFTFAGSSEAALSEAADAVIDLKGRFVCAGFNESHMHILNYGESLNCAALGEHTGSLEEMLRCLSEFEEAHSHTEGGWLIGRGFNQDYFCDEHRMPTRNDLDRVSTDVPIMAVRCCGHALVVNSRAIELLGITSDMPCPEGGLIGMKNGEPDGILYDNAMSIVYDAIPEPDEDELAEMIGLACRKLNSFGVTSAHSDDYSAFSGISWQRIKQVFERLDRDGELSVRVYEQSNLPVLEELKQFISEGNITGRGSDRFRTGPLKLVADGSLGARTAFLHEPYADAPGELGFSCFSQQQLDELIGYANANGMQVAIHAIGDACLDMVLDAIEKALAENPRRNHRHGIVHCQITLPDQLKRIIDMQLHVYAQTIFLDYDSRIVEARVGRERAASSYSWKTLMDGGVSVSNGSDCPVELPIPLRGIQCAVTRTSLSGGQAYLPEQAFTVAEAIDSYTIRSAEAAFEEDTKGLIRPGYIADFVVLDADPFTVASDKISDINVLAAFVGGECVYHS